MTYDVLADLKTKYAEQQAIVDRALKTLSHLQVAIAAIEGNNSTKSVAPEARQGDAGNLTRRRGMLKRTVLDCVREGIGTTAEIHAACSSRGIATSKNSISNTLRALHPIVIYDTARSQYVLQSNKRSNLLEALQKSVEQIEGSKVVPLKPSQNGGPTSTT